MKTHPRTTYSPFSEPLRRSLPGALAGLLLATGSATAADVAPPPAPVMTAPAPAFTWIVTLYGWGSGLTGDQALFGLPPVKLDVGFGAILKNLDFAAMGLVEGHWGRWGIIGDISYSKLSISEKLGAGPLFGGTKVNVSAFTGLGAVSYRVLEGSWGHVDGLVGVRVWSMGNKVTVRPGTLGIGARAVDTEGWIDPMVGVMARFNLSEKWFIKTWGMIGGAGIGADLTWDVLAAVGYHFNERWSASAGYRALGVDYSTTRFTYDMIQHGPVLGVTARF